MDLTLWILQGVLAFVMLLSGFMKLTNSNADLIKRGNGRMDWADDMSAINMKLVGLVELLAAFGLTLPHLLDIVPVLTPIAAVGVVMTMFGALSLHMKRGDGTEASFINFVILFLAAFVAYGRFMLIPA